jgi:uncharacterized membrane protein YesL
MKEINFTKILAKSFLILLIIFFQTMLLFAFLLKSLAMLIAILVIFNAICYLIYYCCDLTINTEQKITLDN